MKISIEKIKVMPRIRKEVSGIEELAANIREHGLINPITVMKSGDEYQLLAGLRRLTAVKLNGETEINATVVPAADAEEALRIEISENEQREAFTLSEKLDYARLIEEIERVKARERKSEGGKKHGSGYTKTESPSLRLGKTRDFVGEKIGMSGMQYNRAKYVAQNATPEIIAEIDSGKRTIGGVYNELRAKEKPELVRQSKSKDGEIAALKTRIAELEAALALANAWIDELESREKTRKGLNI